MAVTARITIFALNKKATPMKTIHFVVNSLTHYLKDRTADFLTHALGTELTLMPDPENLMDPYAVMVFAGVERIGFVAHTYVEQVWQGLADKEDQLTAVVSKVDMEGLFLVAKAEVELKHQGTLYDPAPYLAWHYDGPVIMDDAQRNLLFVSKRLHTLLTCGKPWNAAASEVMQTFMQLHERDISGEMNRLRIELTHLLIEADAEDTRKAARELDNVNSWLVSTKNRQNVVRFLTETLPQSEECTHKLGDSTTDLMRVEEQLEQFPERLYDEFKNRPEIFVRKVYYRNIPREVVRRLFSGIALMVRSGRVEVRLQAPEEGKPATGEAIATLYEAKTPTGIPQKKTAEAENLEQQMLVFLAPLHPHVTPRYKGAIDKLWAAIMREFHDELRQIGKQKHTDFNKKLLCCIVGELRQKGIYNALVSEMEFARLLMGNSYTSMRTYINQGFVAYPEVAAYERRLNKHTDELVGKRVF